MVTWHGYVLIKFEYNDNETKQKRGKFMISYPIFFFLKQLKFIERFWQTKENKLWSVTLTRYDVQRDTIWYMWVQRR